MALEIKLTAGEVAQKAASIPFTDTTGAFESESNPGGYGGDNILESPDTTEIAYLQWRYWGSEEFGDPFALTVPQITALVGSGLTLTPTDVGLSETETDVFADGVHQVKYYPGVIALGTDDNPIQATFTNASTTVTLALGQDIEAYIEAGITHVIVGGVLYELNLSGTNNDTTLTLADAFEGATAAHDLVLLASGDEKVLVLEGGEACIVSAIGKLADRTDSCRTQEMEINKLLRWKFAANVQFDCEDYEGAHNLALAIKKSCDSGKCICNL